MSDVQNQSKLPGQRAIFTLPPELLSEAKRYAKFFHNGNNSGFVAEAIRSYIDHLRKVRHTEKLRKSYADVAKEREVAADWDPASDEAWAMLDVPPRRRA